VELGYAASVRANLAHHLCLGLGEAGCILPVSLATFGFSGQGLPVLVAHPVTAFAGNDANFLSLVNGATNAKKLPVNLYDCSCHNISAIVLGVSLWAIIVGR